MERAQDINVHHGLECINGELVNGREEIARCASAKELVSLMKNAKIGVSQHDKINATQLLCTTIRGILQVLSFAHIYGADADDFCAWTHGRDILGSGFGLFDVAANNAGVCSEMNQSADLATTDSASTAGAEDDLVCC